MHILLIHQIFVTPEQSGGTRHFEFAKFLVDQGHRVTVITSDVDYQAGREKACSKPDIVGLTIFQLSSDGQCIAVSYLEHWHFCYFLSQLFLKGCQSGMWI